MSQNSWHRTSRSTPRRAGPKRNRVRVVLTGIRIPFGSAVALLLKWTIAAIPAVLVLCAVIALAFVVATQVLGGDVARLIP